MAAVVKFVDAGIERSKNKASSLLTRLVARISRLLAGLQ
jgi:hypothetical protein